MTRFAAGRCATCRRAAVALALAGGLGAGSATHAQSAPSGLEVRTEREYYDVEGTTAEEVLASMRQGARELEGDAAFAWTAADTEYQYRYAADRAEGRCRMSQVDVLVRVTVTLPRWTPRRASWALRNQWNDYLRALERHEDGHVRLARRGGERILRSLEGLRAPSCEALGERAKAEAERILGRIDEEQRRYDEETRHGQTQGVIWKVTVEGRRSR